MNKVRLGDVATYINGYAFKPADRGSVGLPIIRIQDLTGNSYDLGFYDGEYPERIEINDGDVLISWSASLGVYVWNKGKALLNQHIFKVVFDKLEIDKQFFVYAVEHNLQEMVKQTHGATMKHIIKKDFDNTLIPYPTLEQQKRIAKSLDKVCNLIEKLKTQSALLDEFIKSRFVEMFGDIGTNSKGWLLSPLEEVAEIRIGPFGSLLHKEDYVCNCHALVNPSHIVDGKIKTDEKLTINNEKYQEMSAYHLQKGDIVLGRRGEMGRCAVVEQEGLLCGTGSMIIRPNGKIKPFFLQTILSSPLYKRILEDKAVGVTMLNLNVPIISSITIPLLPIELQDSFIGLLQSVEKQKATVQQSIDKFETLKKSLMQEYFG